jgi:hypothetical protein
MSKAAGVSPQTRLDTFVIDSHPISSFDRNAQAKSSSIRYALAYAGIRPSSDTSLAISSASTRMAVLIC